MGNTHEPLSEVDAEGFARSWADAWDSHDAARIAAHYSEDVEYHSPFVARLTGGDALQGRVAVEAYDRHAGPLPRPPLRTRDHRCHWGREHRLGVPQRGRPAGGGDPRARRRRADRARALPLPVYRTGRAHGRSRQRGELTCPTTRPRACLRTTGRARWLPRAPRRTPGSPTSARTHAHGV